MKILRAIITLLVVGGIAAGVYFATRSAAPEHTARRNGRGGGGPVSVIAEQARLANVPVYLEGVGSAKARNTILIRPQVDGRLTSVNFKEGQDVKKGDLLAKIDPVTYQAQLDQALAKKALDEAQLANTKRDLERFEKVGTLAVSQQQIDTQRALILQQQAQIKSDDASIENLSAILGYTNIVAPIDGRTGIRLVDEGNLVRAGDATGIVVITEIKPISVIFTLPQQQLPTLSKAMADKTGLQAEAFTTDGHAMLDTGALQVLDNQVDPQTGTVRLKADFPNATLQLWPGQFVNVRLLVDTLKDVVVAPAAAVQRGPNGPYVFVVGPDDAVSMHPVKVTQQDEKDAVIADGLKAGDNVVTSGFGRLEDGTRVTLSDGRAKPPAVISEPAKMPNSSKAGEARLGQADIPETPAVTVPDEGDAPHKSRHKGNGQGRHEHRGDSGATP